MTFLPKTKPRNLALSKSLILRGLQCPKSLYLHKFCPELRSPISPSQQFLFQVGRKIGKVARRLFPQGIEIPFEGLSISEQLDKTKKEIRAGQTTLYEPAFSYDNIFVKTDILHKTRDKWTLYEVKGATSLKEYYFEDIAVQYHVLKGLDLPISKACLVYINNEYERSGELEIEKLFIIQDITGIVIETQNFIQTTIRSLREMLKKEMPEVDIGIHCLQPYECDFREYCWSKIPATESVFDLKGRREIPFNLYKQGYIYLKDIPLDTLKGEQKIQVEMALTKGKLLNKDNVTRFLKSLWLPIYFLDFETYQCAIPPFDKLKPYQQIPYQYSLHSLETAESVLKHDEFLARPGSDARKEIIERLTRKIPANACVLVYYQTFEENILKQLALAFPDYEKPLQVITSNLRDLAYPFKNKDVYTWQMKGSYSLKSVLPALAPELSYEDMPIRNGEMAMDAYYKMGKSTDPNEIEKIKKALLEYCKLDTLAMVKLLEKLQQLTK